MGWVLKSKLGAAANAADAGAGLSGERCFFKSIFSMADSSGHSSGRKYRVASETDAGLWLDAEWRCSSKGMSHVTDRPNKTV